MKKFTKIFATMLVCVLAVVALCACEAKPNSDPSKAISGLENNGYTAAKVDIPTFLKGLGIDSWVSGTKTEGEGENAKTNHVSIIYFTSEAKAQSAWETIQAYAQNSDSDSDGSDWTIKQSGAMIYYGTSAAIKAAK